MLPSFKLMYLNRDFNVHNIDKDKDNKVIVDICNISCIT